MADEFGYDKLQLTRTANADTLKANVHKLNEYEPVIVEDDSNLVWKDSADNIQDLAIVLTSPNGSKYKLAVDDDGNLSAILI